MSLLAYATKIITFGTVNYQTGNLILKDPITGTGNMLKSAKDKLFNDPNDGVWLGKKPFHKIGFSSYLIQNKDLNNLHYVIRVDGQIWHLRTDGVEYGQPQIVKCNQPGDSFQWFYKGQTECEIQKIVDFLNQKFSYHGVVIKNGQLVVKALYYYTRKLADLNRCGRVGAWTRQDTQYDLKCA